MSQTPTTRRQLRERDYPSSSSSSMTSISSSASSSSFSSPGFAAGRGGRGRGGRGRGRGGRGGGSKTAKMRTRLSTGTLVMNGTSTMKEKDMRTPPLANPASSDVSKDTPTTSSKRRAAAAEITMSVPPKRIKILKSDGSECDPFCWLCHKDDCNVSCPLCPRSYHSKCLMLVSVPSDWACGECEKIMEAGCMDTRSRAMKQISTDTLSLLLRYALDRMRQPGSEVFQKPANTADLLFYCDIVVNPMDFSTLEKNIKKKEYGSTEEFLADAKWILHNCIIYNGLHHKLTPVARNVVKSCKHEMAEIEVCPQCYKHSCISGEANWFIEPCDPPHPLVWAKLKGYPFWPAKAMVEVNAGVDVRFFGAHDKSVIPVSHVFMLSKDPPTTMGKKKAGFVTATDEVKEHVEVIREKYGSFEYAPFRTPYDRGHVYMNYKLKGVNMMAAKRFKVAAHGRFAARKETEKLSATSKTASAVKSKYSFLFSKKSSSTTTITTANTTTTATTITNKPKRGRPPRASHPPDWSPETAEKAIRKALSDCGRTSASKSLFINPTVKVTDIIQQKMQKQQEMEEKEEEEEVEVEDDEDVCSVSDVVTTEANEKEKRAREDSSSSGSGTDEVGEEKPTQDRPADENDEEKFAVTKESTGDGGRGSSVAARKTAHAEATMEKSREKQPEKVGTVSGTELEMTSKDEAVQDIEREADGRSSEGVQGASEKNTATKESPEKSENGKELPQEKTQVDDSVTKKTDEHCEPSAVTTEKSAENKSGTGEKDKAGKAAATVESAQEESKTSQPVSSKAATSATSTEKSPCEKKAENSSAMVQHRGSSKSCPVSEPASSSESSGVSVSTPSSESSAVSVPAPSSESSAVNVPTLSSESSAVNVPAPSSESSAVNVSASSSESSAVNVPASSSESSAVSVPASSSESSAVNVPASSSESSAVNVPASSSENSAVNVPASSSESSGVSVPAPSEKTVAKNSSDSAAEQSTVSSPHTSHSPKSSPDLVVTEVSHKSGEEYRDSLMKTIEACKGKLGITDVEEVDDPMDVSDDEDSLFSKDDQRSQEGTAEVTAESQISTDSQDSRISLEMEVDSIPSSTSKGDLKSDSEMLSEKKTTSNKETDSVLGTSGSKSDSEILVGKKQMPDTDSDSVSTRSETQSSSTDKNGESGRGSSEVRVSLLPKDAVSDLHADAAGESKGTKPTAHVERCQVQAVSAETAPQGSVDSAILRLGISGSLDVKTVSPPSSQSNSATYTVAKRSVSEVVIAEKKIAKAASILNKAFELAAGSGKRKAGLSDQPTTMARPSPALSSFLRKEISRTVPCVPVSVTEQPSEGKVITVSCAVPSLSVSESSNQKSKTSSGTSSGSSQINPITIVDDDEPSLLMEVETEAERDEPLVIDLDDEGLDMNENEAVNSQKSNSGGFLRELAPSPAVLKSLSKPLSGAPQAQSGAPQAQGGAPQAQSGAPQAQSGAPQAQSNSPPKKMRKRLKKKLKAHSPDGSSPVVSPSSSSSSLSALSEPCGMVISEVRSLSGTSHDWKEDSSNKKAVSSPPKPAVSQPQPAAVTASPVEPSQPLLQQNFRMPPTPPVEASSQGNSASPSTSRVASMSAVTSSSGGDVDDTPVVSAVDRGGPPEEPRPAEPCPPQTLTPAAVSLVNKYSQQIVGNMQLQLAEMSKELLSSAFSERESLIEQRLKEEKEQLQWTLTEVQHNHKTTIAEMKACWEAEMSKAVQDMVNKMTKEKEEAVAETKKKQWCADCWKEALYYCCWNTSYCSYACQQRHWTTHQHHCCQVLDTASATATTATEPAFATPTPSSTFLASACSAASAALVSIRPGSSNSDKDVMKAGDSGQTQKFSIQNPRAGTVNVIQGEDMWRNRLPQNIQFLSTQLPLSSQVMRLPPPASSQPLQQLQYLGNLARNTMPAAFQTTPQVQLLGQRPVVNMVLPSSMFPLMRHSQPGTASTSQNIVLNPNTNTHYQSL